jgi:hypothetical protein
MATLTPEEQWAQINYPSFMGAALAKVKEIRDSMINESAYADWVTAYLNDVPIKFNDGEAPSDWINVNIGVEHDGMPQVSLKIPLCWVEG